MDGKQMPIVTHSISFGRVNLPLQSIPCCVFKIMEMFYLQTISATKNVISLISWDKAQPNILEKLGVYKIKHITVRWLAPKWSQTLELFTIVGYSHLCNCHLHKFLIFYFS